VEILRRKVRIWKFFFKKRRRYCHYCRHRRPYIYVILYRTVATSDTRGASGPGSICMYVSRSRVSEREDGRAESERACEIASEKASKRAI